MTRPVLFPRAALVCALTSASVWIPLASAQPAGERITPQGAGVSRAPGSKGPLPDPVLLDGAGQPAEKKSEYGLLGQFELPGEEPAGDGKAAAAQRPGPSADSAQGSGVAGSSPASTAGAGGAQGMPQAGQPGGVAGAGDPAGAAQGRGGAAQSSGSQAKGSGKSGTIASGGDPSAQAQGIQVAELVGDPSGQAGNGPGGTGQKPAAVALGDKAMRIEPAANAPGVVGAGGQKVSESTQQYEKGTGSGGRGPSGVGGGNRVEKGRVVPAGL